LPVIGQQVALQRAGIVEPAHPGEELPRIVLDRVGCEDQRARLEQRIVEVDQRRERGEHVEQGAPTALAVIGKVEAQARGSLGTLRR
jgi:hypothetical protein